VNKARGSLPLKYRNSDLFVIYDDLDASVRYYTTEVVGNDYINYEYSKKVRIERSRDENEEATTYETPLGKLTQRRRFADWGCSWHYSEYLIKSLQDMKVMEYLVGERRLSFRQDFFEEAERKVGNRGVVQFYWFERAPLQSLFLLYMGFENAILFLNDYPKEMKHLLQVLTTGQDALFEVLEKCPAKVLNFPENIDSFIDSPPIFKDYLLPHYLRRVKQLHAVDKYCHIHIDGSIGPLLNLIGTTGCDAIEGLTSLPQGDLRVEALRAAIGETILLDGIPAIMFLPNCPEKDTIDFAWKVIELFYPNLILGVSDELPPDADIERVRKVSQIVAEFNRSRPGQERNAPSAEKS
jgi:uroporphyrinogen-III decarboxylase